MALATILGEQDALPGLQESLRVKIEAGEIAERWVPQIEGWVATARHELEMLAVAFEEGEEQEYKGVKDLKRLKFIDANSDLFDPDSGDLQYYFNTETVCRGYNIEYLGTLLLFDEVVTEDCKDMDFMKDAMLSNNRVLFDLLCEQRPHLITWDCLELAVEIHIPYMLQKLLKLIDIESHGGNLITHLGEQCKKMAPHVAEDNLRILLDDGRSVPTSYSLAQFLLNNSKCAKLILKRVNKRVNPEYLSVDFILDLYRHNKESAIKLLREDGRVNMDVYDMCFLPAMIGRSYRV